MALRPPKGTALVCLSAGGLDTARRLAVVLPGSQIHGLAGRADGADVSFTDTMGHIGDLFLAGVPIVGLCASGILIRATAPYLADKRSEPAVVAVAEDGSVAVPLLGGHHGANALAKVCAETLSGVAAVTTAGDLAFGLALDEPPEGWTLANPEAIKPVTAALLAGEPVALHVEAGEAAWLLTSGATFEAEGARHAVRLTHRRVQTRPNELVYHPRVLTVGVGTERGAEPAELIGLVHDVLARHGLAEDAVAAVASLDLKGDEPAVLAAADSLGVPLALFDAATLEAERPRLRTPSETVFREVGCHGVAEGAALAAAGPDAELAVAKTRSKRATCAVARAPKAIVSAGGTPGSLVLVGLGPGGSAMRSPEASRAIAQATDLVGYGYYLDLAGPLGAAKTRHDFALGEEEARCRAALDLAGQGKHVALLCSGDPGIYAMASLTWELVDRTNEPAWRAISIAVVPGISALQGAAARAGAPLGHDFCAISLSDLLTPWSVIEQRVRGAAVGDFVVAFYTPVSQARRAHLEAARDILLTERPAATPVVVARHVGRDGEAIAPTTLGALKADDADMMSLVLVGSSQTRSFERAGRRIVYTPRGYAAKRETGA